MSQQFPETEVDQSAIEGEASHEIAALLIERAARGYDTTPDDEFLGKPASNGVLYDQDMIDCARIYVEDVIVVMRDTGIFAKGLGVEEKLTMPDIHELMFGTSDCFIYDGHRGHLYVWDYKYGHDYVDEFENWQGISYINGIISKFGITGIDEQNITVHLRIAQPRCYSAKGAIREWTFTLSDIRGHFNVLRANAAEALSPHAVTRTGSHCKHCSARHACGAALNAGNKLYEVATHPTPLDMSPDAIGVQYSIIKRALDHLTSLESAYNEQVKLLMKSGVNVPGWTTESTYGREKWVDAESTKQMGELLGLDFTKPADLITPNQVRQLLKKSGIDEAVINGYSDRTNTGIKIVSDNGNKAKRAFK